MLRLELDFDRAAGCARPARFVAVLALAVLASLGTSLG